ncbi:uncharacterized protein LOC121392198 isoform X2 [Gigantopelta aegis]|uniref:uncharacterized protein LOC121392198 isoform X2 n=1 Tax=Gigantopelta aegis TaxID=1735272 RepID=UPI001B8897F7|nr:uncharacterized protein LOC121392198 isoform X2 [Gigantopelta aegis]
MLKYVGVWMMTLCVVRLNMDGNTSLSAATKYGDMEPWWMVDLRGYFDIHDVIVTNFTYSNLWRRLHSFTIDVFMENPIGCARATPVQCYNRNDTLGRGETVQFKCRSPVIGRFVRIKKWRMENNYDTLMLSEVQVLGTRATDCAFSRLFHRVRETRLNSANDVISGVDVMNCASRCGRRDCLAFIYNQNSQQCQLISAPTFDDSTTMTSSWDYYGVDLC